MDTSNNNNNNNNSKKEINKLQTIAQIPPHLAFNKYIISGYRVNYSFQECLKSLLQLHNETINIYTHGNFYFSNYNSFHSLGHFHYLSDTFRTLFCLITKFLRITNHLQIFSH